MKDRKWYQKKRYIFPSLAIGFVILALNNSNNQPTPIQTQESTYTSQVQGTSYSPQIQKYQFQQATNNQQENNNLSNDNSYTNVDGVTVHSPAYSENGQAPDGATAQCRDGTYSFSLHRSGTCSHHGGVASWL